MVSCCVDDAAAMLQRGCSGTDRRALDELLGILAGHTASHVPGGGGRVMSCGSLLCTAIWRGQQP
eukprot:364664-Chlamydomonas_euryale.AAC.2